ncbi:MAG: SLC13 family permease [Candidatus Woesearchaeota archaeon]
MLFGATVVIITRQISIIHALKSINLEVMLFLFNMFIIGTAMEESGYLAHLSYKIFKKARNTNQLLLLIIFVMGFSSAILMNDTVAIIGTPMVLLLAKKHKIKPKTLLLALAFSITLSSVMSPLGNPQNFLIATQSKIKNPFITFLEHLFLPTMINLVAAFLLLKLFYREEFKNNKLDHSQEPIKDNKLACLLLSSEYLFLQIQQKLLFLLIFSLRFVLLLHCSLLLILASFLQSCFQLPKQRTLWFQLLFELATEDKEQLMEHLISIG